MTAPPHAFRKPRGRWWALGGVLVLLGAGAGVAETAPTMALINESPSVPRGLYLRAFGSAPARGALVALPQPEHARRYLRGLGMPREVRLLKRVAAVPGDRVCRAGTTIRIGDRAVPLKLRDRRGTSLPQWRDCRGLGPGELFLLGDTPGSFDSRYFGPVRVTDLDGVFVETLTW